MNKEVSPFYDDQYMTLTIMADQMAREGYYFGKQQKNNQYGWVRIGLLERLVCWIKHIFGSDSGQEFCVKKTIQTANSYFESLKNEKNFNEKFSEHFLKSIKEGHFSESTKRIVAIFELFKGQLQMKDKIIEGLNKKLEEKDTQEVSQNSEPVQSEWVKNEVSHEESTAEVSSDNQKEAIEEPVQELPQTKSTKVAEENSEQEIEQSSQKAAFEVSGDKQDDQHKETIEEVVPQPAQPQKQSIEKEVVKKGQDQELEITLEELGQKGALTPCKFDDALIEELVKKEIHFAVDSLKASKAFLSDLFVTKEFLLRLPRGSYYLIPGETCTRFAPTIHEFIEFYHYAVKEKQDWAEMPIPIPLLLQKGEKPPTFSGVCETFFIDKTNKIKGAYVEKADDSLCPILKQDRQELHSFAMFCYPKDSVNDPDIVKHYSDSLNSLREKSKK